MYIIKRTKCNIHLYEQYIIHYKQRIKFFSVILLYFRYSKPVYFLSVEIWRSAYNSVYLRFSGELSGKITLRITLVKGQFSINEEEKKVSCLHAFLMLISVLLLFNFIFICNSPCTLLFYINDQYDIIKCREMKNLKAE